MQGFKPLFSFLILLLTLTICGCGGSPTGPTVYVAGYQGASSGGWPYTPDYWTNTQGTVANPLAVGSGMNDSEAFSVAISGNDVYIAGYVGSMTSDSNAAYWDNGSINILPNPSGMVENQANAITVSGSDIYVVGNVWNLTAYCDFFINPGAATYWDNDVVAVLPTPDEACDSAGANAIAVSGGNVYIAGNWLDMTTSKWVAAYWLNGAVNILPNPSGTNQAQADSIAVSGSDVYIAGIAADYTTDTTVNLYWKNGTPIVLSNPSGTSTEMFTIVSNSIAVSGSDVYVAGTVHENTTGAEVPVYWKNGTPTILPNPGGLNWANANSIVVSGSDVYVAGEEYDNTGVGANSKACYWKNGGPAIDLSDGTYEAFGNSIAVQE